MKINIRPILIGFIIAIIAIILAFNGVLSDWWVAHERAMANRTICIILGGV